ncbi:MAG: CHAD domain-containing protein [Brachymonas denitrificans]
MNTEIELSLSLSPSHNAEFKRKVAKLLPQASKPVEQLLVSIYYDTPALDLAKRRMGLRLRKQGNQWIQTVKFGQKGGGGLNARTEVEHITHGQMLELANIGHVEARDFLCDDKIATRLQPTFATHITRTLWEVEDKKGNIVELALDVGHIECDGREHPVNEVEIELKRGDVEGVFTLALMLARNFALLPQQRSKAERGYRLFEQVPTTPVGAQDVKLDPEITPYEARRQVMLECLRQLQFNMVELGQHEDDMEFVHQARVAIRRMRSADKAFAALPTDSVWNQLEAKLQTLGQQLGEIRDRDVLVRETIAAVEPTLSDKLRLEPIKKRLMVQREALMQALREDLESPRIGMLLLQVLHWLHQDPPAEAAEGKLRPFTRDALNRRASSVDKLARRWHKLNEEQRHTLRKQVKKLRYTAEFFATLYDADKVKKYLSSQQAMQKVLGTMNDAAVCRHMLETLASQYPETAFAGGAVAGWYERIDLESSQRTEQALEALKEARPFW